MLAMVALLLLQQQGTAAGPTVGDTIWLRRTIPVSDGSTVRPPEWAPEGDVELLGRPVMEMRGDTVVLRFPLVAWTSGTHRVTIPGATVLHPDGSADTLSATTASFTVRTVLPDQPLPEIQPQPPASVVTRTSVSWLPVVAVLGLAALLLGPLQWWWRRRGRPLALDLDPGATDVPAGQWAEAGERRAVLAHGAARLRAAVEARVPSAHRGMDTAYLIRMLHEHGTGLPVGEIGELLQALDSARFAPETDVAAAPLYEAAVRLAGKVERGDRP